MTKRSSNTSFPTISVVISTMVKNLDNFVNDFPFFSLHDADEVVIIIQGNLDKRPKAILNNEYIIIEDRGRGVSRSRNIGLLRSSCDYIWFMDDDILLNNDAIMTVKNYILKNNVDIYTVRMKDNNNGRPYKNYPSKHNLNRFDIINISSVEIIASRQFIMQSRVRFNESLGLGTQYPSCEENIFLLDLFDLGAKIMHIAEYVQKHPDVNRRLHFKNPNILFAKGVFCKRYNGIIGIMIMFFWFWKSLMCGSNVKNSFNLLYGYNSADTILE